MNIQEIQFHIAHFFNNSFEIQNQSSTFANSKFKVI